MQFGSPVSHPPKPAALTLLCWECTRSGSERALFFFSSLVVSPGNSHSIWPKNKNKNNNFSSWLSLWLKTGREREGGRAREMRVRKNRNILISFPRQRQESLNQLHTPFCSSSSSSPPPATGARSSHKRQVCVICDLLLDLSCARPQRRLLQPCLLLPVIHPEPRWAK